MSNRLNYTIGAFIGMLIIGTVIATQFMPGIDQIISWEDNEGYNHTLIFENGVLMNYSANKVTSFAGSAIEEGLTSYYAFEETSGAVIDNIDNFDGTNYGATRGISGKIGNAFDFEHDNTNYVDVGAAFNYSSNFSINAWVNIESSPATYYLIGPKSSGGFTVGVTSSNVIRFSDSVSTFVDSTNTISDSTWTMVTIVYDGDYVNFYLDGVLGGSQAFAPNISTPREYYIGKTFSGEGWDGKIDEMGFWNRTLTLSEIEQLYYNGKGLTY